MNEYILFTVLWLTFATIAVTRVLFIRKRKIPRLPDENSNRDLFN